MRMAEFVAVAVVFFVIGFVTFTGGVDDFCKRSWYPKAVFNGDIKP